MVLNPTKILLGVLVAGATGIPGAYITKKFIFDRNIDGNSKDSKADEKTNEKDKSSQKENGALSAPGPN